MTGLLSKEELAAIRRRHAEGEASDPRLVSEQPAMLIVLASRRHRDRRALLAHLDALAEAVRELPIVEVHDPGTVLNGVQFAGVSGSYIERAAVLALLDRQ